MSMKDWDFGYYGKGLDGYVHFRQGIKEIESHAPYSKCRHGRDDSLDDLDDLDEYDDPEDDLFYEPPQKTPVKRGIKHSKWWKYKWDYGFLASTLAFLYFLMRAEALQTAAGDSTAWRVGMVFLVFLGIEVIRFVIWFFKSMW